MLVNRLEEANQANFTRGQADYRLLLISLLLENYTVTKEIAIDNEILVLRRGKKKYFIGKIGL